MRPGLPPTHRPLEGWRSAPGPARSLARTQGLTRQAVLGRSARSGRSGGTGRRDGLKIRFSKGSVGSSPSSGTKADAVRRPSGLDDGLASAYQALLAYSRKVCIPNMPTSASTTPCAAPQSHAEPLSTEPGTPPPSAPHRPSNKRLARERDTLSAGVIRLPIVGAAMPEAAAAVPAPLWPEPRLAPLTAACAAAHRLASRPTEPGLSGPGLPPATLWLPAGASHGALPAPSPSEQKAYLGVAHCLRASTQGLHDASARIRLRAMLWTAAAPRLSHPLLAAQAQGALGRDFFLDLSAHAPLGCLEQMNLERVALSLPETAASVDVAPAGPSLLRAVRLKLLASWVPELRQRLYVKHAILHLHLHLAGNRAEALGQLGMAFFDDHTAAGADALSQAQGASLRIFLAQQQVPPAPEPEESALGRRHLALHLSRLADDMDVNGRRRSAACRSRRFCGNARTTCSVATCCRSSECSTFWTWASRCVKIRDSSSL